MIETGFSLHGELSGQARHAFRRVGFMCVERSYDFAKEDALIIKLRPCFSVVPGLFIMLLTAAGPANADPTIINSTYLGGSLDDLGYAVAMQGDNTFIAGTTFSLDFPVVAVSSSKPEDEQTPDVFVTALGPSGTPIYSTYVAMGDDYESVLGIGVGPDGSAYVAALAYHGEDTSAVVAKLEPTGELAWTREEAGRFFAQGMTVDAQGNVYVTGRDTSAGIDAAFLWKIDPDGSTSYWAEIDGDGFDIGRDVAVDAGGNAYVIGITGSTDLADNEKIPAGANAFVTKLDPAGSILWSTCLGGNDEDWGERIAVAANGDLLVAGTTRSSDMPTLKAIQPQLRDAKDLFLARLTSVGERVFATYLGGSFNEAVLDLALKGSSLFLAVVSPWSDSPLRQPLDPSCENDSNFLVQLDAGTAQAVDAACLGHSVIYGVAAGSSGVALTGAAGPGLPLVGPWQPAPAGGDDAFAAKLVLKTTRSALPPR